MKMQGVVRAVVMAGLLVAPMAMQAQRPNAPSVTAANSADAGRVNRELLTSTVHEAWLASDRNEDKFFDMVKRCAEMSAQKRGVTLPDTEAAGRKMGTLIKTMARRDPDQLLYAVVDAAVKQTAPPPVRASK
ncbi:hypothetical protein Terro_0587 [Terriglobus roseus DSM 18391]|uniref:Uncharacterized protein n=1 Tax=Terriglobus roseus (strain DSM 18391 / NRRL B-41598 / KBS 63) TaxID=926566 RepID=I3ZCF9_TERRK|nr:hypothetical protein [Terriglobus roseus]AFL86927.1 hypothetical protein Terro_0587 [Terriglobus roseus DSM 18391]